MPELPDITLYIEALRERILGRRLERSRVLSPFLLRSVDPSIEAANGASVVALERLGKRIAIGFDNDVWLVLHLMIAGPAAVAAELARIVHAPNGCWRSVSRAARWCSPRPARRSELRCTSCAGGRRSRRISRAESSSIA